MSQQVKSYLKTRKLEVLNNSTDDSYEILSRSYDFLIMILSRSFDVVEPSFVRKLELLEALLFSFVEHSLNLDMLDQIEDHIQEFHGSIDSGGVKH